MKKNIHIIGAGAWGTALALASVRAGCKTTLYTQTLEQVEMILETGHNNRYLPGVLIPPELHVTADLSHLQDAHVILLGLVALFKPTLSPDISHLQQSLDTLKNQIPSPLEAEKLHALENRLSSLEKNLERKEAEPSTSGPSDLKTLKAILLCDEALMALNKGEPIEKFLLHLKTLGHEVHPLAESAPSTWPSWLNKWVKVKKTQTPDLTYQLEDLRKTLWQTFLSGDTP